MKLSKFNFYFPFIKDENKKIIYNSRTGSLALLNPENYKQIEDMETTGKEIDDQGFAGNLVQGGYALEDNIYEDELIKYNLFSSRYSTSSLTLTIAPTMNCNFACVYCYEKNNIHNSNMSQEVQDEILQIVKNRIPIINSLHISWYGGEPLLAFGIVEKLSNELIRLCEENNIRYTASIISNGYLLRKEVAEKFEALKINSIQVTLDGPSEIHNKRRPLIGGQGTYDKIIENLSESANLIKNIVVRINTDINNLDRVDEVLDCLENNGLKDKARAYLGLVDDTNGCYQKQDCLSKQLFSENALNFERKLEARGFKYNMLNNYPHPRNNYCGADCVRNMIIDPEGFVYKCTREIGMKEFAVQKLVDNESFKGNKSRLLEYLMYDPTMDNECGKCKLLPICMGGCPNDRLSNKERCTNHKYTAEMFLKDCAVKLYEDKHKNDAQ